MSDNTELVPLLVKSIERDPNGLLTYQRDIGQRSGTSGRSFLAEFEAFKAALIAERDEARRIAEAQRIELYGAQFLAYPLPWESPSEGGNPNV